MQTSHSTANTTKHRWILTALCFALNLYSANAATLGNLQQTIIENAAQIKILDCFMAYQQRQHLGGYDSEEEAESTQHSNTRDTTESFRGDATLPTDNHLHVSIVNGSQGVAQYTRWTDLLDLATQKKSDVMVISEPGERQQSKR